MFINTYQKWQPWIPHDVFDNSLSILEFSRLKNLNLKFSSKVLDIDISNTSSYMNGATFKMDVFLDVVTHKNKSDRVHGT